MIHKCEANMRMDPDSPLNRAHQMERQAERMLSSGQYEQATAWYEEAAEHLQVAMQHTQNPSALLSLTLQLENLRKQPQLITNRQQWGRRKQESVLTVWNGRFSNGDATNGHDEPDLTCNGDNTVVMGGGEKDHREVEQRRMRTDSLESRYSSEEADSLLMMIRQHRVIENEQPRYRVSQLLEALRMLSLGRPRHLEPAPSKDQSLAKAAAEGKGPKTIVEELLLQNRELQSHLMQLFQVLDSCERENQQLKQTVADLNRQLEECRVFHTRDDDQFGIVNDVRLDAPFSLVDGFACTPPTESLPPLSPLHLPDFVEDMS